MWPGQAEGRHRRGGHSRQGGVCREQHRPETAVQRHGRGQARARAGLRRAGSAGRPEQQPEQAGRGAHPQGRAAPGQAGRGAAVALAALAAGHGEGAAVRGHGAVGAGRGAGFHHQDAARVGCRERGEARGWRALSPGGGYGPDARTAATASSQGPGGFPWCLRALRCVWGPRSSVPWARGVPSPPQTRLHHDTGPWGQGATWGSPLPLPTDGHQGGLSALGFRVQREHQAPHSPWSLPGTGKSREMGGKGREDTAAGSRLSGSWVAEPWGGGASAPDPRRVCPPAPADMHAQPPPRWAGSERQVPGLSSRRVSWDCRGVRSEDGPTPQAWCPAGRSSGLCRLSSLQARAGQLFAGRPAAGGVPRKRVHGGPGPGLVSPQLLLQDPLPLLRHPPHSGGVPAHRPSGAVHPPQRSAGACHHVVRLSGCPHVPLPWRAGTAPRPEDTLAVLPGWPGGQTDAAGGQGGAGGRRGEGGHRRPRSLGFATRGPRGVQSCPGSRS